MNNCCTFFRTSIGKKWVVAVTGVILLGFVIGHLVGNLQVFSGPGDGSAPPKMNSYAHFLQGLGSLLWAARLGLLAAVVLHILFTIKLALENRAAKGAGAQFKKTVQARISTRTMIWSGSYILCFILFHLAHFTLLWVHPEWKQMRDPFGLPDVLANVLIGFSNPIVSLFYIVGMVLLCLHLSHGIDSLGQTLGVRTQRVRGLLRYGGQALAIALAIGFISIPVAVLAGFGDDYREQALAKASAQKEGK